MRGIVLALGLAFAGSSFAVFDAIPLPQPLFSNNNQGCCSWHSGVAGYGYNGEVICNDGTVSPSCHA